MKINLKGKKGFTTVDLTIAMIVVLFFVTTLTSFSYNIYLSSIEAKRTAVALNYAVDIFEHIGIMDFDSVDNSYDLFEIKGMEKKEFISDTLEETTVRVGNYRITAEVQDYLDGNKIKIITLKIQYAVSRKNTETLELRRLKINEDI